MLALIDADMLLYECSAVAEYPKDEPIKGFNFVKEVFDGRIRDILAATGSEEYTLYITGEGNFREEIAVSKPYKGTRTSEKPFHYKNLKTHILAQPQAVLVSGMEADDQMSITQTERLGWSSREGSHDDDPYELDPRFCDTIICTRDKDLRITRGWHYGWECGRQPEFKKRFIDEMGWIELSKDRKSVKGGGLKFFYSQLLTGDKVDNIPGLEGYGPVAAVDQLANAANEEELFHLVRTNYIMRHPDDWQTYLLEQGRLLWMVNELDEEGQPVMWEFPEV